MASSPSPMDLTRLCIWTLSGDSKLPVYPSCIGKLLSHVGDCLPKQFSKIVPDVENRTPILPVLLQAWGEF